MPATGQVIRHPPPRVLGVYAFAPRRGRTYGTLLVDMERRQPIEILPDTQAETLARWLQTHPPRFR